MRLKRNKTFFKSAPFIVHPAIRLFARTGIADALREAKRGATMTPQNNTAHIIRADGITNIFKCQGRKVFVAWHTDLGEGYKVEEWCKCSFGQVKKTFTYESERAAANHFNNYTESDAAEFLEFVKGLEAEV